MNKILKEQYLKEYVAWTGEEIEDRRMAILRRIFKKLELFEGIVGTDFSNFSTEVAKYTIENIGTGSKGYVYMMISELKRYVDWCIENGFSINKVNQLKYINTNSLDFTIATKIPLVKDEEHLYNVLEIGSQDNSDGIIDLVYKFIHMYMPMKEVLAVYKSIC